MGNMLSIDEVLQFAIRIEERGHEFYARQAALRRGPVADLLRRLAHDESQHKATFQKMLSGVASYQPSGAYPDEYFLYLRSYADQTIFSDAAVKTLSETAPVREVLEFALARELASITYYSEMRAFLSPEHHEQVEKIIAEERSHFARLSAMKTSL